MAEAERDRAVEVAAALADGDLAPLAAYLREGLPVDALLAHEIADMIDGEGGTFRLVAVGRHRGQRSFSRIVDSHQHKMTIGVYVEAQQRAKGPGTFEAAVKEAQTRFGRGRTVVTEAHAYFRAQLERTHTAPGVDAWEALRASYSADFD